MSAPTEALYVRLLLIVANYSSRWLNSKQDSVTTAVLNCNTLSPLQHRATQIMQQTDKQTMQLKFQDNVTIFGKYEGNNASSQFMNVSNTPICMIW